MAGNTVNNDFRYPQDGDTDYEDSFETFFGQIDRAVEIRDTDGNKGNYDPKDNAKYFATDTESIYTGDGTNWSQLQTSGKDPTFNSVETPSINNNGSSISINDKIDLSPGSANLRLDTGQAFEDGSGTERMSLLSGATQIKGESGTAMALFNESSSRIDFSNLAVDIRMSEGKAIEDETGNPRFKIGDIVPGTHLAYQDGTDALLLQSGNIHSVELNNGEKWQLKDGDMGDVAVSYTTDTSTGTLELEKAKLDLSPGSANLRLGTGQAIEDENGDARFKIGDTSPGTFLLYEDGSDALTLQQGGIHRVELTNGETWQMWDNDMTDVAVQYTTDTSTGTLELTNAKLDLSPGSANLRLDTGQSIEDGSGTERLGLDSSRTWLSSDSGFSAGETRIVLDDANGLNLWTTADTPLQVKDDEGDFTAVEYTTDSTTGTLELTNAAQVYREQSSEPAAPTDGYAVWADSSDGKLKAKDSGGNITTIVS